MADIVSFQSGNREDAGLPAVGSSPMGSVAGAGVVAATKGQRRRCRVWFRVDGRRRKGEKGGSEKRRTRDAILAV